MPVKVLGKKSKPVEAAMYLLFRDLGTSTQEDVKMFLEALIAEICQWEVRALTLGLCISCRPWPWQKPTHFPFRLP